MPNYHQRGIYPLDFIVEFATNATLARGRSISVEQLTHSEHHLETVDDDTLLNTQSTIELIFYAELSVPSEKLKQFFEEVMDKGITAKLPQRLIENVLRKFANGIQQDAELREKTGMEMCETRVPVLAFKEVGRDPFGDPVYVLAAIDERYKRYWKLFADRDWERDENEEFRFYS